MATSDRSRLTSRPDTRDDDATDVLLAILEGESRPEELLVAGDPTGRIADSLDPLGTRIHSWNRAAVSRTLPTPWPVGEGILAASLRLPRAKEALDMSLHALAGVLAPGAHLYVYGANDEGIKSAGKRMAAVLDDVQTIDSRKHCRVWRGTARASTEGLRTAQDDWAKVQTLALPVGPEATVDCEIRSFPGTFAKGGLDDASAALLRALPAPKPQARVLDFAAGLGILARAIAERQPEIEVQLLDADALASAAARVNIAAAPAPAGRTAKVATGDGWRAAPAYRRFDLIVSNPPIHTGKGRDYRVLTELVEVAPRRLLPGGTLWIVIQRQIPLREMLDANFDDVSVAWEDSRFRVWRCGTLADRLDI